MARKPKNATQGGVSPLPTPQDEEPVVQDTFAGDIIIDTSTETETISSEPTPETVISHTYYKVNLFDCEQRIYDEMPWALKEIERCNDYIFAKADVDRRFATYRDELYEYRYKMRQLVFSPNYPNISESKFPKRPDYVPDE